MYLAEVGINGWSAVCSNLNEARSLTKAELERRNLPNIPWAIWHDGVFFEGNWPDARK